MNRSSKLRWAMVASIVAGFFFAAYALAQTGSSPNTGGGGSLVTAASTQAGYANDPSAADGSGGAACACCGSSEPTENGITGEPAEGAATVVGDVQKIDVDLSSGIYAPNVIKLVAGVPAEITFGQGAGCLAQVMSQELGFFEDLSAGPRTVKLPALEAGEYPFSCGMQMVFGKIVVVDQPVS